MSDTVSLAPTYATLDPYARLDSLDDHTHTPATQLIRLGSRHMDDSEQAQYVYYQIFQNSRALGSYESFDDEYNALARVRRIGIAPPRTIASFCRCVLGLEGFELSDIYEIYFDNSEVPASPRDLLSFVVGDPGTKPDAPIALILRDSALRQPRPSSNLGHMRPKRTPVYLDQVPPDVARPGPGWQMVQAKQKLCILDWDGGEWIQNASRLPIIMAHEVLWVRLGVTRRLILHYPENEHPEYITCHQAIQIRTGRMGGTFRVQMACTEAGAITCEAKPKEERGKLGKFQIYSHCVRIIRKKWGPVPRVSPQMAEVPT
ncbi:hypothetical protein DL93DRAFT_2102077 [Clavulina sp. PMI_390]|nr:hypothetical protein DL93DRAFT_2102077 [Clavulina sp. PMI_390]